MSNHKQGEGKREPNVAGRPVDCYPPCWMSTQELEDQVFEAAVADSSAGRADADFGRIDAYLAADHSETDGDYRRTLIDLLADLRPLLADLLGVPRTKP